MNDHVVSAPTAEPGTAIAEYSETERGLAELRGRLANVVFDVTTTKGLDEAKKARAECRGLRVGLDKLRKQLNEDDQRRIAIRNGKAKEITSQIEALEDPIDVQIKAREAQQEQARIERERAAAEQLRKINDAIANIERLPLDNLNSTAEELRAGIDALVADELQDFDEVHLPTAQAAKDASLTKLREMLAAREAAEAQAAQLAEQRAELERLQAEAAERDRAAQTQREAEDAERRARELAAEHVADLRDIPAGLVGKSSDIIRGAIVEVEAIDPNHTRFGALRVEADAAKVAVLSKLTGMLEASVEQERIAAEQADRQRQLDAQAAEQRQRQQEAEEAERARRAQEAAEAEERERQAAEEAAQRQREQEEDAIQRATLVEAATEAHAVLVELGHAAHITTRKLAAALAKETQA